MSDFHAILATPAEHIVRKSDEHAIREMLRVVADAEAVEIYVGLPVNLKNESTASTKDAVDIARSLAALTETPVYLIDERMTTSVARQALTAAGKSLKTQRAYIDSAAAAVILEVALEAERTSGVVTAQLAKDYPNA